MPATCPNCGAPAAQPEAAAGSGVCARCGASVPAPRPPSSRSVPSGDEIAEALTDIELTEELTLPPDLGSALPQLLAALQAPPAGAAPNPTAPDPATSDPAPTAPPPASAAPQLDRARPAPTSAGPASGPPSPAPTATPPASAAPQVDRARPAPTAAPPRPDAADRLQRPGGAAAPPPTAPTWPQGASSSPRPSTTPARRRAPNADAGGWGRSTATERTAPERGQRRYSHLTELDLPLPSDPRQDAAPPPEITPLRRLAAWMNRIPTPLRAALVLLPLGLGIWLLAVTFSPRLGAGFVQPELTRLRLKAAPDGPIIAELRKGQAVTQVLERGAYTLVLVEPTGPVGFVKTAHLGRHDPGVAPAALRFSDCAPDGDHPAECAARVERQRSRCERACGPTPQLDFSCRRRCRAAAQACMRSCAP